ncbi:MAG: hypothetical protein P8Z40_09825 [Chloroflexota bacterium]
MFLDEGVQEAAVDPGAVFRRDVVPAVVLGEVVEAGVEGARRIGELALDLGLVDDVALVAGVQPARRTSNAAQN